MVEYVVHRQDLLAALFKGHVQISFVKKRGFAKEASKSVSALVKAIWRPYIFSLDTLRGTSCERELVQDQVLAQIHAAHYCPL